MNILHVCPLWYPISCDSPGGIETFLAQLVVSLNALGCQNTLVASGDSNANAEIISVMPTHLYKQMTVEKSASEYSYYEQHQLHLTLLNAAKYDIIHCHSGVGAFVLSSIPGLLSRTLHTIHTPVGTDFQWFVKQHPKLWFSSVSHYQAQKLVEKGAIRCYVVHNGIDTLTFTFDPRTHQQQLLYIGRIEFEKGADIAVQVARELQLALTLAGPILEPHFFKETIEPYLDDTIRYVGVVDHATKTQLFGSVGCVVLPFRREEPFGLVAIESMACGTPVVALANGALPEIIEDGLTGYLAQNEIDLPRLVKQAMNLDRSKICSQARSRFDISSVAQQYYKLYQEIIEIAIDFNNCLEMKGNE